MADEHRSEAAIRLRKFIDVVVEDKVSFTLFRASIADISLTGMRVISDQYLPKRTVYTFSFKRAPFFVFRGEVRWVRAFERDTFAVGVRYVDLSEADQGRLQQFLAIERQRIPS
jgi:c-di-GMP-binding flagellar brake protein YcgR